jgi:hypothetical protein
MEPLGSEPSSIAQKTLTMTARTTRRSKDVVAAVACYALGALSLWAFLIVPTSDLTDTVNGRTNTKNVSVASATGVSVNETNDPWVDPTSVVATGTGSKQWIYPTSTASGIDPIFLEFVEEAERRSKDDFASSHRSGERGFVVGPTAGDMRHTMQAMWNVKRMRVIQKMGGEWDQDIRVALITSQDHVDRLQRCPEVETIDDGHYREACRLWANGTLFDDIVISKTPPWTNEDHGEQHSTTYWMTALSGSLLGPYTTTIFLDSDALLCPGFGKLFALIRPYSKKLWMMPSTETVDLAAGVDQYPMSGNYPWHAPDCPRPPGDEEFLNEIRSQSELNTGTVLFHYHRELVHTFAHFLPLVAEHVYNNVATPRTKVVHDQVPFLLALLIFKKFRPSFNQQYIPMHTSCRSYPGVDYALIDGDINGMLLPSLDGKLCRECSCSTCLVTHLAVFPLRINGTTGWEE